MHVPFLSPHRCLQYWHEELLGSVILEEAVKFDTGYDAGLADHEKEALRIEREAAGKKKRVQDEQYVAARFGLLYMY